MHNIGFSSNYNWESRPWATGLDANLNVIDLSQPANWAGAIPGSQFVGCHGTTSLQAYPNLGGINYQCNCQRMIYHSGTIKLEKRYSYGPELPHVPDLAEGYPERPGQISTSPTN